MKENKKILLGNPVYQTLDLLENYEEGKSWDKRSMPIEKLRDELSIDTKETADYLNSLLCLKLVTCSDLGCKVSLEGGILLRVLKKGLQLKKAGK